MFFKVLSVSLVLLAASANAQLQVLKADGVIADQGKAAFLVAGEMLSGAAVNEAGLVGRSVAGVAITAQSAPGIFPLAKSMYDGMVAGKIKHGDVNFTNLGEIVGQSNLNTLGMQAAVVTAASTGKLTEASLKAAIKSTPAAFAAPSVLASKNVDARTLLAVVGASDVALSSMASEEEAARAAGAVQEMLTSGAEACARDGVGVHTCVQDGLKGISNLAGMGAFKASGGEFNAVAGFQTKVAEGFQDEKGRATAADYHSGHKAITGSMNEKWQVDAANAYAETGEEVSFAGFNPKSFNQAEKHMKQCLIGQAI